MLHRVMMTVLLWVAYLLGAIVFAAVIITGYKQYQLQDEADFIAETQGKYGGYTTVAHEHLLEFTRDRNFDISKMEVEVSAPDEPVPWGTPVSTTIRYQHQVKVGNLITPFYVELIGEGWDVSRYVEGKYAVTYMSP